MGLVNHDFYPPKGGLGVEAYRLYRMLEKHVGVEVTVFSGSENSLENHVRIPSVKSPAFGPIVFSARVSLIIDRLATEYGLDLIQVYGGPGGVFLLKRPGLPVLYVANHTYAQQKEYLGKAFYRLLVRLERRSYGFARHIVAISSTTRDSLVEDYGIPPQKVTVIPVGVDSDFYRPLDLDRIPNSLLYVGRLCERKNLHCLLEALRIVRDEISDVELYIIGEGELRSSLEEKAHRCGVSGNVTFLGKVPERDLVEWYNRASVFVLPSLFEGFGIVCAEAMACGTPVIATGTPGITDVIENRRNGILVSSNEHELARAIVLLLSDPQLRRSFGSAGRKKVLEDFRWESVTERIMGIYNMYERGERDASVV